MKKRSDFFLTLFLDRGFLMGFDFYFFNIMHCREDPVDKSFLGE
jgi:hypothetical protein